MNEITTIAVDLAKRVFQLAGENDRGEEIWRRRIGTRDAFAAFLAKLDPSVTVLMETGPGAQAWARQLKDRGFRVRVLPAHRVAEHRSGHKNDQRDASALLRAGRDTSIHEVPIKSVEQLSMQALHRVRSGWIRRRTALSNQMRGLLLDHGVAIAKGHSALTRHLDQLLESAAVPLPALVRELLAELAAERAALSSRIDRLDAELARLVREDADASRLSQIRGIGPVTASALVCKSVTRDRFRHARDLPAYFGLVPRQHTSGEKQRLGRMSRGGDHYIKGCLIQGAQSVIRQLREDDRTVLAQRLRRWVSRHGAKGAAVRLANHNLRVTWVLLTRSEDYQRFTIASETPMN